MIHEEHKKELKRIYYFYSEIHEKLTELANETVKLEQIRVKLSQELDNTRKLEKELINNIEQQTGEKIDQTVLLKIIHGDGQ